MEQGELIDLLARAAAADELWDEPRQWDRDAAEVAVRRWRSYSRRHKGAAGHEDRVADLARGLRERMDPDGMQPRGWHRHTAEVLADVLREHLP
jgi:hypothetical protein